LLLDHFNLNQDHDEAFAFRRNEASNLISKGRTDELLDRIIQKYKALEKKSDFILCEGTDFVSESSAFEFGTNIQVAKNLGSSVLIIGRGDLGRPAEEILSPIRLAIESFHEEDFDVMGAIVNRCRPEIIDEVKSLLRDQLPSKDLFLSVIPSNDILRSPTVGDVAKQLNAEVLYGEEYLEKQVFEFTIAAMQLPNFLPKIKENSLVITPGDRGEIILGTLEAHLSKNYPQISGIMLSAGWKPESSVMKLLDGLPHRFPIISVKSNTFETATKLDHIQSYITADNKTKIHESLRTFEAHMDMESFEDKTSRVVSRGMTPRMFQYMLTQKAKNQKKHIVLPEGSDDRILKASAILVDQDIVDLTILGNKEEVEKGLNKLGLQGYAEKLNIIEPRTSEQLQRYSREFFEIRKAKGVNMEMAHDAMNDVSYFGTMMVYLGEADGMVSGAQHTTQHTIRPALQFVKTKKGFSVVSSVFFMCLEDRVLVYGDCAINPNPNAEQLAQIAISSARTAEAFGVEPRIAMLSYSSGESGKGADVEKVREATRLVKSEAPELKVEGPIQYDAAVDAGVGAKKMPGSDVAGKASVLIFPDLNTGNNTYKAVQRETGAVAIGPVLQGLNKPVNDLSRGCTITDIVNTVIITAIQAQQD
jgi:phosphate acetyltransferase